MTGKLSRRDIRALKLGAVCAACVLLFAFALKWLDNWGQVRGSLAATKAEFKAVRLAGVKQAALLSIVPVFEMPQSEEEQKFLFREKFNEQLKKAGIKSNPLQILPAVGLRGRSDYKLLRIKCGVGECKFGQLLDLLAGMNENPYLVGIEELSIKCNEKEREKVKVDLTVSTLVKSKE